MGTTFGVFRYDGGTWLVGMGERVLRLADRKGLHDLACLLVEPGRGIHVLELAGHGDSSSADLLEDLRRLREDDVLGRISDLDASDVARRVDRARKAVTNRIRTSVRIIAGHDRAIGAHLAEALRTGALCSYRPVGAVRWRVVLPARAPSPGRSSHPVSTTSACTGEPRLAIAPRAWPTHRPTSFAVSGWSETSFAVSSTSACRRRSDPCSMPRCD